MFFCLFKWITRVSNLTLFCFFSFEVYNGGLPSDIEQWLIFSLLAVCSLSAVTYTFLAHQREEKVFISQYWKRKKLENEITILKAEQELKELKNQER